MTDIVKRLADLVRKSFLRPLPPELERNALLRKLREKKAQEDAGVEIKP